MCVLAFHWQIASTSHSASLRLLSNRDEFFSRPTVAAHWWPEEQAQVLGGKDLSKGGSWLALNRTGRLAVITNFRDPIDPVPSSELSRGDLVRRWVSQAHADTASATLAQTLADEAQQYPGFNLLLFDLATDTGGAWVIANRAKRHGQGNTLQVVAPGTHSLSNHLLNTPWPKTTTLRQAVSQAQPQSQALLSQAEEVRYFAALSDRRQAPSEALPDTGIDQARERYLSSVNIVPEAHDQGFAYGTRCSSIVSLQNGQAEFIEWTRQPSLSAVRYAFALNTGG